MNKRAGTRRRRRPAQIRSRTSCSASARPSGTPSVSADLWDAMESRRGCPRRAFRRMTRAGAGRAEPGENGRVLRAAQLLIRSCRAGPRRPRRQLELGFHSSDALGPSHRRSARAARRGHRRGARADAEQRRCSETARSAPRSEVSERPAFVIATVSLPRGFARLALEPRHLGVREAGPGHPPLRSAGLPVSIGHRRQGNSMRGSLRRLLTGSRARSASTPRSHRGRSRRRSQQVRAEGHCLS